MMTDEKMPAFMLAGIFGMPPTQNLRQAMFLAPNRDLAITMFVSQCHATLGETQLCVSISCAEIRPDVIAAAHRGQAGPAPVVSLVPQGGLGDQNALAPMPVDAGGQFRSPWAPPDGAA